MLRRVIAPIAVVCCILLSASIAVAQNYIAQKVIDGDTIRLSNGERVRLIGIDTPETRANAKAKKDSGRSGRDVATITRDGRKAKDFVKELVEGKEVRLEFDVSRRDRYGRLLAYVYLPVLGREDVLLNAEIIEQGYASVMTVPPNVKYAEMFLKLYQEARLQKRGLWSESQTDYKE